MVGVCETADVVSVETTDLEEQPHAITDMAAAPATRQTRAALFFLRTVEVIISRIVLSLIRESIS